MIEKLMYSCYIAFHYSGFLWKININPTWVMKIKSWNWDKIDLGLWFNWLPIDTDMITPVLWTLGTSWGASVSLQYNKNKSRRFHYLLQETHDVDFCNQSLPAMVCDDNYHNVIDFLLKISDYIFKLFFFFSLGFSVNFYYKKKKYSYALHLSLLVNILSHVFSFLPAAFI